MSAGTGAATFTKGLRVMACFETARGGLTMAEIARLTGFDRAATRRLCVSLLEAGVLERDGKVLLLTPRVLALAGGYLSDQDIGRTAQPVLNQFAADLGGEITLAVRDGTRAVYVAQSALASARVSIGFTVGSTLPLLATASGRMLLAGCPDKVVEELLAGAPPQRFTETTEVSPARLRAAVDAAKRQGFALVSGEFEPGAAALAVPATLPRGTPAVLATTAPASAFADADARQKTIETLQAAARLLAPR